MKFIKKYFKQIIYVAVFALFAVIFAFSPSIATIAEGVYAATQLETAFESIHMPIDVVDLSKDPSAELRIPLIKKGISDADYFIRVIDPAGQIHDCKISSSSVEDDYFTKSTDYIKINSLNDGIYNIVYFYNNGGKTVYSYPYQVQVKSVSYELDFVEPDGNLKGTKLLVPSSAKDGTEIVLPNAYVKIADTDNYLLKGDNKTVVYPVVIKDGATIFSVGNGTPEAPEKASDSVQLITEGDNTGKFKLTTNLGSDEAATYIVKYTYLGGSNIPSKDYKINVSTDFEEPKTLTIDKKEMPKNVELGKRNIELPEITAFTEYSQNVDYNITEIRIEKEDNKDIYQVLTNNNRTFDMTVDAFEGAQTYKDLVKDNNNYNVTYKIESFYGLTAEKTFKILGVTDNSAPDVYMAYSYELDGGDWVVAEEGENAGIPVLTPAGESTKVTVKTKQDQTIVGEDKTVYDKDGYPVYDVNTDYAVELKSNYGYGELVFPAIYAQDLVNDYDEFTFVRYFQSNTNVLEKFYIDNIKLDDDNNIVAVSKDDAGYNASGDENIGHFNRIVRFKFNNNAADYSNNKEFTLHYTVINKTTGQNFIVKQENNVYETGRTSYKFKILNRAAVGNSTDSGVEGVSVPTIEINNLKNESSISKTSSLTIKVSAKDELDKRLKNAMFYYTVAPTSSNLEDDLKAEISNLLMNGVWDTTDDDHTEATDAQQLKNYFTNLKCNVLENAALVKAMQTKGYTDFAIIEATDNSTFDLTLNLKSEDKPVVLVAATINDNSNVAIATKTLTVNNTTEEEAPIASLGDSRALTEEETTAGTFHVLNTSTEEEYAQGDVVYLPDVKFEDKDSSLAAVVKYYVINTENQAKIEKNIIPTITYLNPTGVKYKYAAGTAEGTTTTVINGGQITTSAIGTYYVLYTAIDDAGNQTYLTYSFKVKDTSNPILSVNVKGENIEKSGTTINANINSVLTFDYVLKTSEGVEITDASKIDFDIEIVGVKTQASPMLADYGKYSYTFDTPDEYIATVKATYKVSEEDVREADVKIYHINITVPDLTWERDFNVQSQAEIGEEIYLPYVKATHGDAGVPVTVEVHVKDPDNKTPEYGDAKIVNKDGTYYWYFKCNDNTKEEEDSTKFTTRGTYKITYTATSSYGTVPSKTFDIKVGDTIAPTFSFKAGAIAQLSQDIVYDGTHNIEYSIDLVRYSQRTLTIKVYSNGKEIYTVDTGLVIRDKNGTTESQAPVFNNWSNLNVELKTTDGNLTLNDEAKDLEKQYFINGVGKYTLVLTMTDNYGNTATREISFNVVSKSEPKSVNDNVVGIVLIVVSLVVLAGVILFFTLTGKKGGKGGKNKNLKAKEQTKEVESSNQTAATAEAENVEDGNQAKTGEVE